MAFTATAQQIVETREVLVIGRDQRAIETCHARQENDVGRACEFLHLDNREHIDVAFRQTRHNRRAQVLIERQSHAGSASPRSATHA